MTLPTISAADFLASAPAAPNGSSPWALQLPSGHIAWIDQEDVERVRPFKWHALKARNTVYAQTHGSRALGVGRVYLHRFLLDAPKGQMVDHRNRNGLDNRRINLRLCTRSQNFVNAPGRAGYRGVVFHSNNKTNPWRAVCQGKHIGYFSDEWEAAQAYNAVATLAYGEFVMLNVKREDVA